MPIQTPTRITIEIHPAAAAGEVLLDGAIGSSPIVSVIPEFAGAPPQPVTAGAPREHLPLPAAYEPGPCRCLDDEDCAADHANE